MSTGKDDAHALNFIADASEAAVCTEGIQEAE